jgi:hypothetical protein
LGISPTLIDSRQVVNAIAPLAETLFPTLRIPTPRAFKGERWILFEERGRQATGKGMDLVDAEVGKAQEQETQRKKRNRKTTLKSYHPQSQSPSPYTSISRSTTPPPLPSIPPTPKTGGLRKLRLPTSRPISSSPFPALPSAPLRKTSSGELVAGIELPLPHLSGGGGSGGEGGQPVSAGVGKRSFLRPFLLGGGKVWKKVKSDASDTAMQRNVLAELNHVQRHTENPVLSKEKYRMVDTPVDAKPRSKGTPIGDDYLHVELPESPYEETAYISMDDHEHETRGRETKEMTVQPSSKSLEIAVLQGEAKRAEAEPGVMTPIPPRVARLRGDHTPSSPRGGVSRPGSPRTPITPGLMADQSPLTPTTVAPTPITAPLTPPSPAFTPTSPTSTPPTPVLPATPITRLEDPIPVQPTLRDRDKPTEKRRHRTPHEHESSSRESRSRSKRSDDESRSRQHQHTDDGVRRHRHRDDDDDERRRAKRHERQKSKRQIARVRESWLEVLLQDLPFGPDKQMVSHISPRTPCHLTVSMCRQAADDQFRALDKIKKDWRIFVAELVGLMALAYVIQASGW